MKTNNISAITLIVLSLIFAGGLIFASLEFPIYIDKIVKEIINFPGFDQQAGDFNISKTELFIDHYHLKTIGYISFIIIVLMIAIGFF